MTTVRGLGKHFDELEKPNTGISGKVVFMVIKQQAGLLQGCLGKSRVPRLLMYQRSLESEN